MTGDLKQAAVGEVHVLIFHIEHRIDEVLCEQRAEAVFPAEPCEDRRIVGGRLALKV